MLQLLKTYDLKKMGVGSADALTAMIESKRLAYEDLAKWYADPAFVHVPMKELLSDSYANARRKLIHLDHVNPDIGPGNPNLHDGDTIYLTAADKDGMMVSLIQSNYRGMGSGLVADHLGFMFQDRGELYSLDPKEANVYAAGKRPFHTIIPGFLTQQGRAVGPFGVMGGHMQPQGHLQLISNTLDAGMDPQAALDEPRWYWAQGREVHAELGIPAGIREELAARGHQVTAGDATELTGCGQAIWQLPGGGYVAGTEPRTDGCAIGY
jgi:gamma-glutamyltranspeptidase/glutathione hydrolase